MTLRSCYEDQVGQARGRAGAEALHGDMGSGLTGRQHHAQGSFLAQASESIPALGGSSCPLPATSSGPGPPSVPRSPGYRPSSSIPLFPTSPNIRVLCGPAPGPWGGFRGRVWTSGQQLSLHSPSSHHSSHPHHVRCRVTQVPQAGGRQEEQPE